jgi:2-polyprenyl-3-methyl-5-hydroxy-6-metoxy-1,4-benzoquinol methylase
VPNTDSFQLPQEFLIVGAAVKTGLFDAVKDNPCDLQELVARTECDPRAVWTVTEALVALGYLTYEGDKVKLTQEAYAVLYDRSNEKYTGFSFMHAYNLINSWMQLPEVMKSGQPAAKKRSPERAQNFMTAMKHHASQSAPLIAEYCLRGLPANARVLDVGGGPLTYAMAFAEKGAKVTVLDLPEIVDMMQPQLDPSLPIRMEKGDFTRGLPRGPFDLVYLGNVCHIYGEKENRKLFRDAFGELKTGGRIAISDMIRGTGPRAAIFAVNMLVNTSSGGTWTYEQYKTWLEDAGLTADPWVEVGGRQLILAVKQ